MAVAVLAPLFAYAGGAAATAAGYAAGSFVVAAAATAGSIIGGVVGSAIDSAIFAPGGTTSSGPRLDNLKVQDSGYGGGVAVVYGRGKIAGNVIEAAELEEVVKVTVKKSGKWPSRKSNYQKTYTYLGSFAVALCEGGIRRVLKVEGEGKLIYDFDAMQGDTVPEDVNLPYGVVSSSAKLRSEGGIPGLKFDAIRIYRGGNDQEPDPMLERMHGVGNVPGYIGLAYVVIERLLTDDWGRRIPNLVFTVEGLGGEVFDVEVLMPSEAEQAPVSLHGSAALALEGGRWATVGLGADGRLSVTTHRLNAARDGLEAVGTVAGPPVPFSFDRLDTAVSPDGRRVAVVARRGTTIVHTGAILAAVYDDEAGAWLAGDPMVDIALNTHTEGDLVWIGSAAIMAGTASNASRGWLVWSLGDVGLTYHGASWHSLWRRGQITIGNGLLGAAVAIPTGQESSLLLVDCFARAVPEVRAMTAKFTGTGVAFGLDEDLWSGANMVGDLGLGRGSAAASGDEWVVMASSASPAGAPWVATLTVSAAGASSTRAPWFLPEGVRSRGSLAYIGRGRVAAVSVGEGTQTYGEVALADGGFTLRRAPMALPGLALPHSSGTTRPYWMSSAVPGWVAVWADPLSGGRQVYPIRCYDGSEIPLAFIVADRLRRSGYGPDDYDVSDLDDTVIGYTVQQPSASRAILEQLQLYSPFDLVPVDGKFRGVVRTGAITATIPDEWAGAHPAGEQAQPYDRMWLPETDLPRHVSLRFIDPARDFDVNAAPANFDATGALATVTLDVPIAITYDRAKAAAHQRLFAAHAENQKITGQAPLEFSYLAPGDVVAYRGFTIRLQTVRVAPNFVAFGGTPVFPVERGLRLAGDGGPDLGATWQPPPDTDLILLDAAPLSDEEAGMGLQLIVACAEPKRWPGAAVVVTRDGGADYDELATAAGLATVGTCLTALPDGPVAYWDEHAILSVQLPEDAALESADEDAVYAGANLALVGDEILGFRSAEQTGPRSWLLSSFLRGRKATEDRTGAHVAGERFVLLEEGARVFAELELADRGKSLGFKSLTAGQALGDAPTLTLAPQGLALLPKAPVHVEATRDGVTGDLSVTWCRRNRLLVEWLDGMDEPPLDEQAEAYLVDVLSGPAGDTLRTLRVSGPRWTYPAAQQAQDFGGLPAQVTLRVRQVSALLGAGRPAQASLAV